MIEGLILEPAREWVNESHSASDWSDVCLWDSLDLWMGRWTTALIELSDSKAR